MIRATDTKEKIIEIAHEMFAKKGFHGTSVREISQAADVNVAAINYHFKNKEGLYAETIQLSYQQMDEGLKELVEEGQTTEEFAWLAFQHMVNNGDSMVSTFKMMLSSTFPFPKEFEEQSDKNFGPPGGEVIYLQIKKDMPEIKESAIVWAMRGIFTYICHWALMMNTSFCTEMKKDDPDYSMEAKERHIRSHVRAILEYVRNHEEEFV